MELTVQKLDTVERGEWRKQKAIIAKGREDFWTFMKAIKVVRDKRLYREDYKTFEAFVEEECGLSRVHVHRLMEASDVRDELLPMGNKNDAAKTITKERQLRELVDVPKDELEAVVEKAAEIAGDAPITAKIIRKAKSEVLEYEDVQDVIDEVEPETLEEEVRPVTLRIMDNTKYHREIHANVCEALRLLAAVPEGPGTEMLVARSQIIKRELDHVKASIMMTKPHAICPRCKGAGCAQCGNMGWVNSALARELGA